MKFRLSLVSAAVFASLVMMTQASADIVHDYSLVVTGTLTTGAETEGRAIVNNLHVQNATNFGTKNSSSYAGLSTLVVAGNITGNTNPNSVKVMGGNVVLDGSNPNNVIGLTGGGMISTHDASAALLLSQAASEIAAYSSYYSSLATNSTVVLPGSQPAQVTFNATPGADGVAVFSIDGSLFSNSKSQSYQLDPGTATTFVINVTGSSVNFSQGNFLSGFQNNRSKVIFNFANATMITASQNFYGAVLAPNASLTSFNTQEGSLFVKDFTQTAEVHLPTFTGQPMSLVPEPASIVMMAMGLPGCLAAARWRRLRKSAPSAA